MSAHNEINLSIEDFINEYNISTHKDLKKIGEFKSLPIPEKKQLYEKVRYITKKSQLKIVEPINDIGEPEIKGPTNNSIKGNEFLKLKNILTVLLLILIFSFLASESIKFYENFNVFWPFKFLIPICIECSIILLSLKNSKTSKALMISLVLFNIFSFSIKTIQADQKLNDIKISNLNTINQIKHENIKIEEQIKLINSEKGDYLKNYNGLIENKYFKLAENNFSLKLKDLERQRIILQNKFESNNQAIIKLNSSAAIRPINNLGYDTIAMVFLKIIMQLTLVYLLLDLKAHLIQPENINQYYQ